MNKAYILHANQKYFDIVVQCAKSIKQWSNYPIYIYMVDSYRSDYIPGVKFIHWPLKLKGSNQKYINDSDNFYINRSDSDIYQILIQKPLIAKHALENFADVIAYVDSDSIATPFVDKIFDFESNIPMFAEGIYDWLHYNGRGGADTREDLSTTLEHPICELFKIDQYRRLDKRYRQTGYFVVNKTHIDFLEEWYWMCNHPTILKDTGYYCPYHEETILNPLLWEKEIYNGLPLVYVNGTLETIDEIYLKLGFTGHDRDIKPWLRIPSNIENLLFFHGEKRIEIMNQMITKLKHLYERHFITSS